MDPALSVKSFSAYFGNKKILNSITIDIPKKSITAIVGPSGCGKSTFIRSINRMNDRIENFRSEGKILFDEKDILSKSYPLEILRMRIGMVFQKPNPFPKSIYDNIAFGLKIHGIRNKKAVSKRVNEALKEAAIYEQVKECLNMNAFKLSGGQQQRLCIARALAVKPEILLLDEPTSAIDPIATKQIEKTLEKLSKEYTIIIVTHDIQQAARISDYIAFFYLGELVEFGETKQVLSCPKKKLTNDYLVGIYS